ncbi:MAG: hypothetical protein AAF471_01375, partial [Myxococcota bacterium]
MHVPVIESATQQEAMIKMKGNKHVWWIGGVALAGGLCVMNACGGASSGSSSEAENGEQLVFSSVKDLETARKKMESCATRGRFKDCWIPGNSCTWYSKIITFTDGELHYSGNCYLDCSDIGGIDDLGTACGLDILATVLAEGRM